MTNAIPIQHINQTNIDTIRETMPADQAKEAQPGCITWKMRRGAVTLWPEEQRAAVSYGGDSAWGDYTGSIDNNDLAIHLDYGVTWKVFQ